MGNTESYVGDPEHEEVSPDDIHFILGHYSRLSTQDIPHLTLRISHL